MTVAPTRARVMWWCADLCKKRIREEANRKRAEAASAGLVGRASAKIKEEQTLVPPQYEGRLNEPEPIRTRDRKAERERETSTAKAKTIGHSRSNRRVIALEAGGEAVSAISRLTGKLCALRNPFPTIGKGY